MVRVEESFVPYEREETPQESESAVRDSIGDFLLEITDSAKTAIIVVLLLFTFVFRAVGVEGTSMNPTLNDGDWLAVTAIDYGGINHGDIVVITQPWRRHVPIIKRVIGVEGDRIDIDFVSGVVAVNGVILEEKYILQKTHLKYDVVFPVTVPENCVFVMGDNRNNSLDSRSDKVGLIDMKYVLGRAFFRFYRETGFIK